MTHNPLFDSLVIITLLILLLNTFRANTHCDDYHTFNALNNNGQTCLLDAFNLSPLSSEEII